MSLGRTILSEFLSGRSVLSLSCVCLSGLTMCPAGAAGDEEAYPLVPYPKVLEPRSGVFTLKDDAAILVSSKVDEADANGAKLFAEDVERALGVKLPVTHGADLPAVNVIAFDGFDVYPLVRDACAERGVAVPEELPAEGYFISIRSDRILAGAADRRGMVCAAMTLGQLLREQDGTVELPCCDIVDHPSLPLRICHMQVPALTVQGWNMFEWRAAQDPKLYRNFPTMKEHMPILEQMTSMALQHKLNAVMIDLCNVFRFESFPDMALPQAVPLKDLKPIIDMCRRYYVEPIPGLNLFAHQEHFLARARPDLMLVKLAEFPKKRVTKYEDFFYWEPVYDPNNPEVRKIVTAVLDETIELFTPKYLHIGHDECGALAFVPRQDNKEIPDLFSGSVKFLHEHLKRRGVRTMMWGDMLLGQRMFPTGAAHGDRQGAPVAQAIKDIPRDVIITDWHYWPYARHYPDKGGPRDDFPSSLYFTDKGFDVLGSTVGKLATTQKHLEKSERHRAHSLNFTKYVAGLNREKARSKGEALGMMVTHWYLNPRWLDSLRQGRAPSVSASAEQFWNAGARRDPVCWRNWSK